MGYRHFYAEDEGHSRNSNSGVGVMGVIQIVLIILKCFNLIDCPWKYVFIPLYISLAAIAITLIIVGIIVLVGYLKEK